MYGTRGICVCGIVYRLATTLVHVGTRIAEDKNLTWSTVSMPGIGVSHAYTVAVRFAISPLMRKGSAKITRYFAVWCSVVERVVIA